MKPKQNNKITKKKPNETTNSKKKLENSPLEKQIVGTRKVYID